MFDVAFICIKFFFFKNIFGINIKKNMALFE